MGLVDGPDLWGLLVVLVVVLVVGSRHAAAGPDGQALSVPGSRDSPSAPIKKGRAASW